MGTLYLVATPIGNLEDSSARALRILGSASLIAAEDTRRAGSLLAHFGLHTPILSYFEHNKLARLDRVLTELDTGDVALVSDAGTPNLSDPGYELVRTVLDAGHAVVAIPGPSAVMTALVASGLPTDAFVYLGFLPRKAGDRQRLLTSVAREPRTLVAYEAPHRLLEALAGIQAALGDRPVAVARELTKLHEEIFRGPASAAREHFAAKEILGEITLVIAGAALAAAAEPWDVEQVRAELTSLLAAGDLKKKDAARLVAEQSGWQAREVYRLAAEDSATDE